jgi:hypothetical protein
VVQVHRYVSPGGEADGEFEGSIGNAVLVDPDHDRRVRPRRSTADRDHRTPRVRGHGSADGAGEHGCHQAGTMIAQDDQRRLVCRPKEQAGRTGQLRTSRGRDSRCQRPHQVDRGVQHSP